MVLALAVNLKDCLITTVVVFWFSGSQSGLYGESAQPPDRGADEHGYGDSGPLQPASQISRESKSLLLPTEPSVPINCF